MPDVSKLLPFQNEAVAAVVNSVTTAWISAIPQGWFPIKEITRATARRVALYSPTGSGKTVMLAHAVKRLMAVDKGLRVLWVSPGTGQLHIQSRDRLVAHGVEAEVLTTDTIERFADGFPSDRVLVASWDSIVGTGTNGDLAMRLTRTQEGKNIFDLARRTSQIPNGRLLLVVDESHRDLSGPETQALLELLAAELQPAELLLLEATATPRIASGVLKLRIQRLKDAGMMAFHTVSRDAVVKARLIKGRTLLNQGLQDQISRMPAVDLDGETTASLLLDTGLKQLEQLEEKYLENKEILEGQLPLLLVQVADGKRGKTQEDMVEAWVKRACAAGRLTKEAVCIWTAAKKSENIAARAIDSASGIRVLIFKQAIATGWDCPRAHVLVTFRDPKSQTFALQVLGRILRMPIPGLPHDRSGDPHDEMGTAYVYANVTQPRWSLAGVEPGTVPLEERSIRGGLTDLAFTRQYKERTAAKQNGITAIELRAALTDQAKTSHGRKTLAALTSALETEAAATETILTGLITHTDHDYRGLHPTAATVNGQTVTVRMSEIDALGKIEAHVRDLATEAGLNATRVWDTVRPHLLSGRRHGGVLPQDRPLQPVGVTTQRMASKAGLDAVSSILCPIFQDARKRNVAADSVESSKAKWVIPTTRRWVFDPSAGPAWRNGTRPSRNATHAYGPEIPDSLYDSRNEECFAEALCTSRDVEAWVKNAAHGEEALTVAYKTEDGRVRHAAPDFIIVLARQVNHPVRVITVEVKDVEDPGYEETAAKLKGFPKWAELQPANTITGLPQRVEAYVAKNVSGGCSLENWWLHSGPTLSLTTPGSDGTANRTAGWRPLNEVLEGARA